MHSEQMLNKRSYGGTGCTSVEEMLAGCYLAGMADVGTSMQAFADSVPLIASTFADPTSWSRSNSTAFGSAASTWNTVTSAYTFPDLALSGADKPVSHSSTHLQPASHSRPPPSEGLLPRAAP